MFDMENQRRHFRNHAATLNTYGPISVLDFKRPGSNEYRIRFVFENDYCRLHISGDLGELSAVNFNNMVIDKFYKDFVFDPQYFEEKVRSHERALYYWDEDGAREDLHRHLDDLEAWQLPAPYDSVDELLDDLLEDFDDRSGLATNDAAIHDLLTGIDPDWWEWAGSIGKRRTGIVELYMLAFRLAWEQLHGGENGNPG